MHREEILVPQLTSENRQRVRPYVSQPNMRQYARHGQPKLGERKMSHVSS